ncbi:MAG TPA: tRNA uridine-5-carboxymethylaminomethyl(34) synthesis GTPase MnmE [Candidatus Bipolaricaulota bacterium]
MEDTIAAIATAPGEAGIGIVRLSGPAAISIAAQLFVASRAVHLEQVPSHTLHHGRLAYRGVALDEVLVAVMRRPQSYTREDVVEVQAHGSPVILRSILEATLACGARMARPGEFTLRAYLNGRLSLDQAQAVLELIQAKTALSAAYALDRLEGKFTRPLQHVREQLLELLAGVGVGLDYPEYEEDALPRATLEASLASALAQVESVLARGKDGRILRQGTSIAIVGRPNVGKSTLLNTLLQADRALVTPVPGTTRDTLEELLEIDGVPFRLVDTAGLRKSADEVERLGMERARAALSRADLGLVLLDLSSPITQEDRAILDLVAGKPYFALLNKADLPHATSPPSALSELKLDPEQTMVISAQTGAGVEQLKAALVRRVWGGLPAHEDAFLLDVRERDLLQRARELLQRAHDTACAGGTLDLVAAEVQDALEALGELTGENAGEAVIERIFSKFCVGK